MNWKIRKKWRRFKFWLMKKLCTESEWRMLRLIRAGYYGKAIKETEVTSLTSSFEVNEASHEFLHSDDGACRYDAKYGLGRQLLKEHEEEIIHNVTYTEAWDEKKQMWICTAELDLVEVVKV